MVRLSASRTWCVAFLCTLAASPGSGRRHRAPFRRADVVQSESPCPKSIETVGDHQSNWTVVHGLDTFFTCLESKLLDFPLYTPIDDDSSEIYIQTAASSRGDAIDFSLVEVPRPRMMPGISGTISRSRSTRLKLHPRRTCPAKCLPPQRS